MVEAQDADEDAEKKEKTALAKIEPVKIEATSPDVQAPDIADSPVGGKIELEKSLLSILLIALLNFLLLISATALFSSN